MRKLLEGLESFDNVAEAWRSEGRAAGGRVVGAGGILDISQIDIPGGSARFVLWSLVSISSACPWCLFKS